jgi:hypothetical protein
LNDIGMKVIKLPDVNILSDRKLNNNDSNDNSVMSEIQVIYNELVFNDKDAPINLWQLKSSDDILAAGFLHAH